MPPNTRALAIGKVVVAAMWIATGSAVFIPGDGLLLEAGRLIFWFTAAAHVIECGIFYPSLRPEHAGAHRSLSENIMLTMIFGVLHYATLKLEALSETNDEPPPHTPAN